MDYSKSATRVTAAAALMLLGIANANAASGPTGIWIDHTGRGAVEIKKCGSRLCGHVVWVKNGNDKKKGCGLQIIGNARHISGSTWDKGWIYSPERKKRYNVELRPISGSKLRVRGYKGSKFFGKTMIWKRAPANLVKCNESKPADEAITAKAAPAKAAPVAEKPTKDNVEPVAKKPTKSAAEVAAAARAEARIEPTVATPGPAPKTELQPSAATDVKPDTGVVKDAETKSSSAVVEDEPDVAYADEDEGNGVDEDFSARDILEGLGRFADKIAEKSKSGDKCDYKLPYLTLRLPCVD